jgi:hypothetical protein
MASVRRRGAGDLDLDGCPGAGRDGGSSTRGAPAWILTSIGVSKTAGSPSMPTSSLPLGASTSRLVVVQRAQPCPAW